MRHPLPLRRASFVLVLASWGALVGTASAADVADWAPPDSIVSVIFRGADAGADLVDLIARRFGGVPNVDRAVRRLRAFEVGGVHPFARGWPPGLALGGGVGFFMSDPGRLRLVLSAPDPKAAQASIVAALSALEVAASQTPEGLQIDHQALRCEGREGLLICQAGGEPVPAKAPGRPGFLDNAPEEVRPEGMLFMHVRGPALDELTDRQRVLTDLWLGLRWLDGRLQLDAVVRPRPELTGPLGLLLAQEGTPAGLDLIDARSGVLFKLSFDGPRMMAGFRALSRGEIPPPARPLFEALESGWSGDLMLTTDGSLTHPVLIVGLTKVAAGRALVEAVAATLSRAGVPARLSKLEGRPGVEALVIEPEPGEARFNVPFAIVGESPPALVVALAPADVLRRVKGRIRSPEIGAGDPGVELRRKGVHGLHLQALPFSFGLPWLNELVGGGAAADAMADAQVLVAALSLLLDEVALEYEPKADTHRIRLWWRFL